MKIAKEVIEVKMEIPGAIIRQKTEFGDATGFGKLVVSFSACRPELTQHRSSLVLKETYASVRIGVTF